MSLWAVTVMPVFADGLDEWTVRPVAVTNDLFAVAPGAGVLVAAGAEGTILVSTNGAQWASPTSHAEENLRGIVHGAGTFVAVGDGGRIVTSTNGLDWVQRNSGSTSQLFAVAFDAGLFVAVGRRDNNAGFDGVILTSPDGANWTTQNSGTQNPLYAVAYGNGIWITAGQLAALASTNGINWSPIAVPNYGQVYSLVHGNGLFVAAGNDIYTPRYAFSVSDTGDSWRRTTANTDGVAWALAFGTRLFAAAGGLQLSFDNPTNQIAVSEDGEHWTVHSVAVIPELRGICYGAGTFVAVGLQGTIVQSGKISRPTLEIQRRPNDAGLDLIVTGEPGFTYLLQSSSTMNTGEWSTVSTLTNGSAVIVLPESAVTNSARQFLRLLTP